MIDNAEWLLYSFQLVHVRANFSPESNFSPQNLYLNYTIMLLYFQKMSSTSFTAPFLEDLANERRPFKYFLKNCKCAALINY